MIRLNVHYCSNNKILQLDKIQLYLIKTWGVFFINNFVL